MNIRLAKKEEVAALSRIARENYSKDSERRARKDLLAMFQAGVTKPTYIVAENNGELMGFAGFIQSWMEYHIYEIFWVNVKPAFQGRRIGTELVKEAIKRIKKAEGEDKAEIIVLSTKSPKFYDRLGFKTVHEYTDNYLMVLEVAN